jgi:nucleotide-binding universal stress UspA family protein
MTSVEKKEPYPFDKIAVAIAFSPRIEAILAESKRLQDAFNARMYFIHVGEKNLQQEQYLKHLLHRFDLDKKDNEILWKQGDPVETILDTCKEHEVDLLVAGALEKESLLKYFMGSVARSLCRKAKCSVLMLREPSIQAKPVRKIVIEGSDHPKTVPTLQTGIYIAQKTLAQSIDIIQESDSSKMALIRSENLSGKETEEHLGKIIQEEHQKIQEVLDNNPYKTLQVHIERLDGKPGYVISKYAREQNADLLMLNSPDTKLNLIDRVFPHDIEYALADLPCDLMLVHSRPEEQL